MTAATPESETVQIYRVYIRSTPEAIWEAMTKPEWTVKYGYAPLLNYEMRVGGAFRAHANEGMLALGCPEIISDGEVIEADPPHKLVQTFRMVMDPAMAAQGFTRVTYEIEERKNGVSRLTLTHELEGAPELAVLMSGGLEDQGAGGGWSWVLSGLKTLLETGQSLDASGHQ